MRNKATRIIGICGLIVFIWLVSDQIQTNYDILGKNVFVVYAQEKVQYTYDSLGRVVSAAYPDGPTIEYIYDGNGNLLSVQTKTSGKDTGNQNTGNANVPFNYNGYISLSNGQGIRIAHDTAVEIAVYNAFKKKKPVIKSLKVLKKKGKRYLKIQIRQVAKRGTDGETGYQIKYAKSSSFKQAKTITVTRAKKGKLTGKKWKAVKNKTYYVKVRAYMKTRLGKTIYTKYSAVKKIKIPE